MLSPPDPLIAVKGLAKTYPGGPPVLRDVSLSIRDGESVALIGANGSGKSTLLKCLVGLHDISGGSVAALGERFQTRPGATQRRAIRRQTGFVFQHHGLVRRLSALSNVVHGFLGQPGSWRAFCQSLAPQSWREAAQETLGAVNLAHKAEARVDALSGGQAQRVAIARALVGKPRLLIADEPTASLDPAAGHDVMGLFCELARNENITLIFTSHDMDHAQRYGERIVALKDGGIHFDKPSGEVRDGDLAGVFDG